MLKCRINILPLLRSLSCCKSSSSNESNEKSGSCKAEASFAPPPMESVFPSVVTVEVFKFEAKAVFCSFPRENPASCGFPNGGRRVILCVLQIPHHTLHTSRHGRSFSPWKCPNIALHQFPPKKPFGESWNNVQK